MAKELWLAAVLAACASCASGEGPAYPTVTIDAAPPVAPTYANPLKVDFMLRGYFYAYAEQSEGLGGYATSENLPRPLAEIRDVLAATDGLHVLALVDQARPFGKHDGFRVIVANASGAPVQFDAQDSRLGIIHEAVDPSGKWAPIEYLPSSWCGNSYHTLTLPPRSYWELAAPHYDGDFATRLRIRVEVRDGDKTRFTYSDAFPGRISRAQFSAKQGHEATNIMDPYND